MAVLLATPAHAQKIRSSGLLYDGPAPLTYVQCYIYNAGPSAVTLRSVTLLVGGVDGGTRGSNCGITLGADKMCAIFGQASEYQYAQCDVSAPASAILRGTLVLLPGSTSRPVNAAPLR